MCVAVVGVGHLGKEHARIYSELEQTRLIGVVDSDPERGNQVANKHSVPFLSEAEPLVEQVDAVSIAVPTPFHLEAARPFLEAGKSVLVEKPMASTLQEADEMISLADSSGSILQVGHIERFNPVLVAALPYVDDPLFIECDRIHPFNPRSTDVSVVLDLMIHDIDLILHMAKGELEDVHALGARVLSPTDDLSTARLVFQNGCTAMVKTSRVALNCSRKIRVFAVRSYLSLDLVKRTGFRVYMEKGYDPHQFLDDSGRIAAPEGAGEFIAKHLRTQQLKIDSFEPLRAELESFVEVTKNGGEPVVSAAQGRRAMATAKMIQECMETHRRWLDDRLRSK